LSANAKYDGESEAEMFVGADKVVKFSHSYGGKGNDTLDTGFISSLRCKWSSFNKKSVESVLKFKNWGPPYYKFKKTFDGAGEAPKTPVDLHPEKKTA
jgi:hypothetical protein